MHTPEGKETAAPIKIHTHTQQVVSAPRAGVENCSEKTTTTKPATMKNHVNKWPYCT